MTSTHWHTHCYMTSNTMSYSLLHDQQHTLKLMVQQGVWIICHTPKHITGEAPNNIPSIPPSEAKSPLNARWCPWKRNIPPWQMLNNNGLWAPTWLYRLHAPIHGYRPHRHTAQHLPQQGPQSNLMHINCDPEYWMNETATPMHKYTSKWKYIYCHSIKVMHTRI